MLHLTAMEGDYVMIGDDIKVMFLKQNKSGVHQIHVGIVAPKSVPVLRDRIYEQKLNDCANDPTRSREEVVNALERLEVHREERLNARAELLNRMAKFNFDESRRLAKKKNKRKKSEEEEME